MSSSKHSASSELKHNKYLDAVQLERKMKKKKRKKEERKGVADEYDDGFRGRWVNGNKTEKWGKNKSYFW